MRFIKKTFSLQSIKLSVICFFCPTAGRKVIIPCSSSNNKRINMLSPVPVLELAATLICHGSACGHLLPHETHTHTYIQNYTTSDFVLFVRLVHAPALCSNQSQNYVQVPVICTTNPIKCKCCRPSRSATLHQLAELSCVSYQHQTEAN